MNLTLPCSECGHDVEVQDGVEKAVCLHCHATLSVEFDGDFVNYLDTPEDAR